VNRIAHELDEPWSHTENGHAGFTIPAPSVPAAWFGYTAVEIRPHT